MPESQFLFEIEALADRARSLWREAQQREATARVELFAKVSFRSKVAREPARAGVTADHAYESGLAVRLLEPGTGGARFASSSGVSSEAFRSIMDVARRLGTRVTDLAPHPSDVGASERWDLDAPARIPAEEDLAACVMGRRDLEWIEAGTTAEVLVGADGWIAGRRRHRVWALIGDGSPQLFAQRGFTGWDRLPEAANLERPAMKVSRSPDLGVLVLTPNAASELVAALAGTFHVGAASRPLEIGAGWALSDEPSHLGGIAGGAFDDVGFPASTRVLAAEGVWKNKLSGPGTFRRNSFREPPKESVTNLVVASGEKATIPIAATAVSRIRIHRISSELWVLELDAQTDPGAGTFERRWISVSPETLLAACTGSLGAATVTARGPIVPSLVLEGLSDRSVE